MRQLLSPGILDRYSSFSFLALVAFAFDFSIDLLEGFAATFSSSIVVSSFSNIIIVFYLLLLCIFNYGKLQ